MPDESNSDWSQYSDAELKKVADEGDPEAQFRWAIRNDLSDHPDYKTALYYYKRAADQVHVKALHNLAIMYFWGRGVPVDYNQTIEFFDRSAEGGYVPARYKVGRVIIDKGKDLGLNRDQVYEQALPRIQSAADQGFNLAYFDLGFMSVKGQGVKKNYVQAGEYFMRFLINPDAGFIDTKTWEQQAKECLERIYHHLMVMLIRHESRGLSRFKTYPDPAKLSGREIHRSIIAPAFEVSAAAANQYLLTLPEFLEKIREVLDNPEVVRERVVGKPELQA